MIDWGQIRWFERHEFKRFGKVEPDEDLVYKLDEARTYAGRPFSISSGIRGPRFEGDDSPHIEGYAVDIRCADSRIRWHMLEALFMVGFKRIGVYDLHIHVDTDPHRPPCVTWLGKSV